ncbi:putative NRPS-like protein biosynthetic cluster [Tricholoma furcatifolium]|nr:putative NRPS-like protein biosynthetic cluster [Tricholoma furcatifolium]
MSSSPILPPIEDLLIPEAIDFNFKHNAEQPFFVFSNPEAPSRTQIVTHLEFGRAAHRMAHILRPNRAGEDGDIVAIVALSDVILYQAIVVGCMIAGLVPFPISPRSSAAALANLLEKTSCHRLITTNVTLKPLIDDLRSHIDSASLSKLRIDEVPSFSSAYPRLGRESMEDPFERYPDPVQRPSLDDLCIYLHSSGSTGFPKAIPQTHRAWMTWALFHPSLSNPLVAGVVDLRDFRPRLTLASMAPPAFHTLGLYVQLLNPVYGIVTIALFPPTATAPDLIPIVPSPVNILEHAKLTKSTGIIVIPALLQIWSQTPEAAKYLSTLAYVGYAGSSLAPKLGKVLVDSGVHLHPIYGGTEFGAPTHPIKIEGKENWEYVRFPDRTKIRWVHQGDGTFECQFLSWEKHRPMVLNLPDVEGYATSDLFVPHPTKEGLWKIVGRIDDVIVHSSGEKTVPAPMEDIIMSSPIIQGALIFGHQYDRAGILIEPKPQYAIDTVNLQALATLRNKLWSVIEEANRIAPAFSRIYKEMILITSDNKPLPRAGKGSVMRKAALALYNEEIVALYNTVESSVRTSEDVVPPTSWTRADVRTWIVEQAADLTSRQVSPTTDLFEQGFDSLSATFLRLRIVGALRSSRHPLASNAIQGLGQNLVYSYPIIIDLADHLVALLESGVPRNVDIKQHSSLIEEMIRKYSSNSSDSLPVTSAPIRPVTVLLTGSTGHIGSEILASLLNDDQVKHVYAFNRPSHEPPTVKQRHLTRFEERGLNIKLLDNGKVSFITGDATRPDLGLDPGQYKELTRSNVIIHNAWRLDFNLSLSAFEPHIQATRHLADLLTSGPNAGASRFLLTSSISSAQSWPKSMGSYPEAILTDTSFAVGGGYGEGKYVAERILSGSGIHSTSLRIGQVSGGQPKGAWSVTDWVPILVKSSVAIGRLPDIQGTVSWMPADVIASAIVEAALSNAELPEALNLVHPRPVEAQDLVKFLQSAITEGLGRDLEITSFAEWIEAIERCANDATAQTLADIPAIKLLEFFRSVSEGTGQTREAGGIPLFSTDKMLEVCCKTMSDIKPLRVEDVILWVMYWKEVGFLN